MNAKSLPSPISMRLRAPALGLVVASVAALLAGCVTEPPVRTVRRVEPAEPLQRVYFYPQNGQSEAQQDRDRYECYNWAVRETGFDPGRRQLPRETRQAVVPTPSGATAVAGALTGAVLGAVVAGPGRAGNGAVVGAAAGGLLGAASEQSAVNDAQRYNDAQARRYDGRVSRDMSEYRRAMSACLEGRGYSVK